MQVIARSPWYPRLAAFFDVVGRRQTYRAVLYLLLSLPLGMAYWILILPGLTASLVTVMLLGVPLLLVLTYIWGGLAAFERRLALRWLGVEIVAPPSPPAQGLNPLKRLLERLRNPITWKTVVYLVLRLPFGIVALVLTVALIALPLALVFLPGVYLLRTAHHPAMQGPNERMLGVAIDGHLSAGALIAFLVLAVAGLALVPVGLRVLNALGAAWGRFARLMLGVNLLALQLAAAESATARERARAARAEQSRRELIVNVSHELRTPISTIRGYVEALVLGTEDARPAGPALTEQRAYLGIVQRETERLSALVDDLLMLARADASELRLELAPVAADAVIDEVYRSVAPLARRERHVTVVCDVVPGLPPVRADRQRLAQVVLNLVRNAITYTPTGGIVSLTLQVADPLHLALTVADTGIGIPPADLAHVFERFYRTDVSRARASGGFGLGLAIVRDLVTAMGGSISAESVLDKGSTFRLLLPIAASTHADRSQIP